MKSSLGASAGAETGSRASHGAAKASPPFGFDPARIIALDGDRYSPNLRKFLRSRATKGYRLGVYHEAEGRLYIGQVFEDDQWFHGAQLNRVLCVGSKAETYAYAPKQLDLTLIEDFWPRYEAIGRCAIDEAHDRWWMHEETRWQTDGDTRHCLWCGNHTQHLRRWAETVERERWEPALAAAARQGRDVKQARGEAPQSGPNASEGNAHE